MGQYLNWVTLLGVALIVGGVLLLVCAVSAAKTLAPARHRRGQGHPLDRLARSPAGEFTRGVAPPVLRQPDIRRSVLLADTMRLHQVAPQQPWPPAKEPADTR